VLEVLTGTGLAIAAGLNAYVPLLLLGLAGRFLDAVALPEAWMWLSSDWVLIGLALLLVIELVADKFPVVDTINDLLQSIVRPAAGGIVFGSGSAAQTLAIAEPDEFFASQQWVPIVVGAVIALLVHLTKMAARPAANALTAGAAAPVLSLTEDLGAVLLSVLALVLPVLVVVVLVALALALPLLLARARRHRLSVDRA
jgi:hypothetical protein